MSTYRLFFFDKAEHIRQWTVIESEDDTGAIRLAGEHTDGRAMELWHEERLVWRYLIPPDRGSRRPVRPRG